MNTKLMVSILVGGATIATGIIAGLFASASSKSKGYMEEKVRKEVQDSRAAEDIDQRNKLDKYEKDIHSMKTREDREFSDKIRNYRRTSGHDDKVKAANASAVRKVNEFKDSIGYDEKKAAAQKSYSDALAEYDSEVSYKETKKKLQNDISVTESKYSTSVNEINRLNANGSITDELASTLKQKEDDARRKAIKDSKDKLDILEKDREARKKELNKEYSRACKSLDDSVDAYDRECRGETARELRVLNDSLKDEEEKIRNDIQAKRSDDELEAINNIDALKSIIDHKDVDEEEEIMNRLDSISFVERVGKYLKSKNLSQLDIYALAAIPVIPFLFGFYKYVTMVVGIASAAA